MTTGRAGYILPRQTDWAFDALRAVWADGGNVAHDFWSNDCLSHGDGEKR